MNPGLLLLSIACAAAYFVTVPWDPFPGSVVLKGLSVAALAAAAFAARVPILGLALAFSSAGDVLLDLDPRLFVGGLGCFLAAHLVYIVLFLRNRKNPMRQARWRILACAGVVAYSAVFSWWLAPSLGSLTAPVFLYIGAITGMALVAILAGFPRPWVMAGALLFVVSDSLLATAKFKSAVPFRDYLVWATYYLGQCSIAVGFLSHAGSREATSCTASDTPPLRSR